MTGTSGFPHTAVLAALGAASLSLAAVSADPLPAAMSIAHDPTGLIATVNLAGPTDLGNPFFQSLGSNGRSCSTCHNAAQAMSITPAHARRLYDATGGADPLFAAVDGANCPTVTRGNRNGHSLLLSTGLIRIGLAVPPNAEFAISVVHDPYGCALQVDPKTSLLTASVYRRPLPSTNLRFLSAIMFDGRETVRPLTTASTFAGNLRADLAHQAIDATLGHAEAATPPSDATVAAIVDFELQLLTGQIASATAGRLDADGADGGPLGLMSQPYHPGINDALGADPAGTPFTPVAMHLYDAWATPATGLTEDRREARADIVAGEKIFNSAPMTITTVRGLNDNTSLNKPVSLVGHCATCHDTPNVGNHSLPLPLDIGTGHTTDPSMESDPLIAAAVAQLSLPDLPVFLISGCPNPFGGAAASFYTTDPGKALITGRCSDFNRVKGPILRGLAARAPYFHNGAATNLSEVVNFYNVRFQMGLSDTQKRQLAAFLSTL